MELNEFIENFLPDFETRAREFWQNNAVEKLPNKEVILKIATSLFPKALQNFTDKLCERQRELCARIVDEFIDSHQTEPFSNGIYVVGDDMTEAEQPNLDDLLTKK